MEVNCEFSDDCISYKCFVINQEIPHPQRIEKFLGEHIGSRSNGNVVMLSFTSCILKSFPRNLKKIFPNLVAIEIVGCNLKELTKDDLRNYPDLLYLTVVDNQVTQLPSDLFQFTPNIQFVDFSCNQITSIGPRIFDTLSSLKMANFSTNRNIDAMMIEDEDLNLEDLIKIIKENCRPLETLKGIAATKLTESISSRNAAEIFFYSCRFGLAGLKRKSFLYIKENMLPELNEMMLDKEETLIKIIAKNIWNL